MCLEPRMTMGDVFGRQEKRIDLATLLLGAGRPSCVQDQHEEWRQLKNKLNKVMCTEDRPLTHNGGATFFPVHSRASAPGYNGRAEMEHNRFSDTCASKVGFFS